eukprot:9990442-Karenia_brevis.AAC.1
MSGRQKLGQDQQGAAATNSALAKPAITEKDDPRLRYLKKNFDRRLEWTAKANRGASEVERDAARDHVWSKASPLIVEGKPGTGKTTNVLKHAKAAAEQGLSVL